MDYITCAYLWYSSLPSLNARAGNQGFVHAGQALYPWATPWVPWNPCLHAFPPVQGSWHGWVFGLGQPWDIGLSLGITPNPPDQCASLVALARKVEAILSALKEVTCKMLRMRANQAVTSKPFSWQRLEWSGSSRESRETNIFWGTLRAWVSYWKYHLIFQSVCCPKVLNMRLWGIWPELCHAVSASLGGGLLTRFHLHLSSSGYQIVFRNGSCHCYVHTELMCKQAN